MEASGLVYTWAVVMLGILFLWIGWQAWEFEKKRRR